MWSTSHLQLHGPRRSHDQSHNELKSSRSSSPEDGTEPRRRTSSDATPRPTPATTRFLSATNDQDTSRNLLNSNASITDKPEGHSSSKRFFFTDKLTSSLSGTASRDAASSKSSLHPTQLLHPHSHSRADSNINAPGLSSASLSVSSTSTSKPHTSPSKASYGRTYDSKLVSREMNRLNLVHLPSALAPQIANAPSGGTIAQQTGPLTQTAVPSLSTAEPWETLHVYVLPLFNGEPLKVPIEILNELVKRHIAMVVSHSPPKALSRLESDASKLITSGMVTLNSKLNGVDDEKLVARVVEIWGFFWDQVLTYLEGVLLPLQTDPLLSSLYRTKPHRATSPSRPSISKTSTQISQSSIHPIDVRSLALRSFRDKVILPPYQRLYARLSMPNRQDSFQETHSYQQPRLQQMLLVLSAQSRQLPHTFSLTTPAPQPTAEEAAIRDLLRLVRNPRPTADPRSTKFKGSPGFQTRTPTFLSGGLPRDRRGRVAQKGKYPPELTNIRSFADDDTILDDVSRKDGSVIHDMEQREREFLEALRSPDIESSTSATRITSGGWGLGAGHEEPAKEDEDEPLDWDQAQAVVERMVGINTSYLDQRRR
ncbi:HbrB-like-domain-containing protein [Panaeolus papilionaceus]|nr:HbrB-like-domain-containing protein [Panaeolus papilionaceus]